jgi:hypothetical protein
VTQQHLASQRSVIFFFCTFFGFDRCLETGSDSPSLTASCFPTNTAYILSPIRWPFSAQSLSLKPGCQALDPDRFRVDSGPPLHASIHFSNLTLLHKPSTLFPRHGKGTLTPQCSGDFAACTFVLATLLLIHAPLRNDKRASPLTYHRYNRAILSLLRPPPPPRRHLYISQAVRHDLV